MTNTPRRTLSAVPLRRLAVLATMLLALGAASGPALAKGVTKYRGIHPLPPHGGQFCYLEVPHVHAKSPSDMRVYRTLPDQQNVFVGDDVALGYEGEKFGYFGPHPLSTPALPTTEKFYCYIRGAHYHANPPPAGPSFVLKDGVNWYVGEFGPEFEREKHNFWINDSGALPTYAPPKVTIGDAPPNYHFPALAAPPSRPAAPMVESGKPGAKVAGSKTGAKPAKPAAASAKGGTP
jgi:hypothetical protein